MAAGIEERRAMLSLAVERQVARLVGIVGLYSNGFQSFQRSLKPWTAYLKVSLIIVSRDGPVSSHRGSTGNDKSGGGGRRDERDRKDRQEVEHRY